MWTAAAALATGATGRGTGARRQLAALGAKNMSVALLSVLPLRAVLWSYGVAILDFLDA